MQTVNPLIAGSRIETLEGKFSVQIEIPPDTTLSDADVRRILELGSWKVPPTRENVSAYEGVRAVIIPKEVAVNKGGMEFAALQVTGIGYRPGTVSSAGDTIFADEKSFLPPTARNFVEEFAGMKMAVQFYDDSEFVVPVIAYRALGTYLPSELEAKVRNTQVAAGLELKRFKVAGVQAVGRYLDTELSDEDGPFGFFVTEVPSVSLKRHGTEFGRKLAQAIDGNGAKSEWKSIRAVMNTFSVVSAQLAYPLFMGLREFHDAGYTMHALHPGNYYFDGREVAVYDWATLRPMTGNRWVDCVNRAIDITNPVNDNLFLLGDFVAPVDPKLITANWNLAVKAYLGLREIDLSKHVDKARRRFGECPQTMIYAVAFALDRHLPKGC
ncbi:hypothetical protein J4419_00420 [Candidatus Woesearchaeota archaeon]|nr:hypothetical protein [Candidatus Woesearchaeota archaeon]